MNSVTTFAVWSLVCAAILSAIMINEYGLRWVESWQRGDTTLGRNSDHWLAGTAFLAAMAICIILS